MELPLLRNAYSVLFAKYESELFTGGAGAVGEGGPTGPFPSPCLVLEPCRDTQYYLRGPVPSWEARWNLHFGGLSLASGRQDCCPLTGGPPEGDCGPPGPFFR